MSSAPSLPGVTPRLLIVLALLGASQPLATDSMLPGFTAIAHAFGVSAAAVQLTLTAFLFGLGGGQLVIGTLSDRLGRRRPLLIALTVYALASIGCALAPGIGVLIGLRFVQGFAAAAGVVLTRSVIRDLSHGPASFQAFSRLNAISSPMPVIAPLLGGLLLPLLAWRGMFVVVAAYVVVVIGLVWRHMPESLPLEQRAAGDWRATCGMAGTVLRNRAYLGYVVVVCVIFGSVLAYVSASAFVFQDVFGLSPERYAFAFAVNSCGIMIASAINTRLVNRFTPERILRLATFAQVGIIGILATQFATGLASVASVLPVTFLFMLSIGFTIGNATALAMNAVRHHLGTAAALLGGLQFAFGAIASPLVGLGGAGTALPMVLVMGACSTVGLAALVLTQRAERHAALAELEAPAPAPGLPAPASADLELQPAVS